MADHPEHQTPRPTAAGLLVAVVVIAALAGRFGGPVGGIVAAVGTAAHEAGHAAVADLIAGDVASITIFRDGGGVTFSESTSSDLRTFLVAGAGYPATLLAALTLLTAALRSLSSRRVAAGVSVAALVTLVLWTPFNAALPVIDDGDQRFTWFVLALLAAIGAGVAALPDRHDTVRRIVLGVLAVGLLSDAFSAGRDLVTIEGRRGDVATDADALAEAVGAGSSATWAWLMRLALFAIAASWAWLLLRRSPPPDERPELPSRP